MATKSKSETNSSNTKLYRSEKDRVVGGVCAGLGDFFQVDPTIIRLIFVLITIFGGGGVILYIILWLIIPSEGSSSTITKENISKNADEMKDKAKQFAKEFKIDHRSGNSKQLLGIVILVFGLLLLMGNFGFFNMSSFGKYLPAILLIIFGALILKKRD